MTRKYTSCLILLFSLFSIVANAQVDRASLQLKIKKEADRMGKSFIKNDYDKFLVYMHPEALIKLGGRERLIQTMAKEEKVMKSQKIKFQKVEFGEPSPVLEKNGTWQALLPQIITMTVPGGTLTSTAHLLSISENNGENWYFLDVSTKSKEQVKALISNFHSAIKIPKWEEPKFTPD